MRYHKKSRSKPILCLDFDGVIHSYQSGWKGVAIIPDPPVPGIGLYILGAIQHFRIAVFSSRSRSLRGRRAMRRYLRQLLWNACLEHCEEAEQAWSATQGTPADWHPWTAYDVRDQADHIGSKIIWPWFNPSAFIKIDDRALTFNGNWSDPIYQPDAIKRFRPWNKKR
jgi:hypothetical protein